MPLAQAFIRSYVFRGSVQRVGFRLNRGRKANLKRLIELTGVQGTSEAQYFTVKRTIPLSDQERA